MALTRVISRPGVKRDGTALDGGTYTDALWCRFQRGLPRKMGGYRTVDQYLTGTSRCLFTQSSAGFQYFHSGYSAGIDQFLINQTGAGSSIANRTPAGYVAGAARSWQFEGQYDNTNSKSMLIAHSGNNTINPSDATNYPLYFGGMYDNTALAAYTLTGNIPNGVSGGITSLAPYLIAYGSDGFWAWSKPGFPLDFTAATSGATQITHQKIVKGLPLRSGGGVSPAGLFWSIDSVIRATFVGGTPVWQWDHLTTQSSILSANTVVEHDGIFYWVGVDRFLTFNGAVQELPNEMNLNWFFDGINQVNASKTFGMKVPRYNEIWWCYPRGANTECSHAVIYNYKGKFWYDTPLPNGGRSAGLHGENLVGNVMAGTLANADTTYNFWQHEYGHDEINPNGINAIQSNFTTGAMTQLADTPPNNNDINLGTMEPDFIQIGDMSVTALKQNNAKDAYHYSDPYTIYAAPANAFQCLVPMRECAKIIYLKFESNVAGGDYQMGQTMIEIDSDVDRTL